MKTEWRILPIVNGLYVSVVSDNGEEIRVATTESASRLVLILRALEEAAAFGHQCEQDRCENAYVEASVLKEAEKVAESVKAFIIGEYRFANRNTKTGYHHRRMVMQLMQILKMPRPETSTASSQAEDGT